MENKNIIIIAVVVVIIAILGVIFATGILNGGLPLHSKQNLWKVLLLEMLA